MTITYGSVCSGIEAATVAWHTLGWKAAWFSEIEPFPNQLLQHHYPNVPNLGDMTTIADRISSGEIDAPDVLVGGTPCQAFSVAGMRGGLSDERGALTISFVGLADEIDRNRKNNGKQPCTIVWENVPGVLSTKDNAFGCFLAALAGEDDALQPPRGKWANAGYVRGPARTVAWRILDAQYFGVAQRRRRVFVVASARDGFCPAQVLFEFDGVRRDFAPSREAGQEATGGSGAGFTASSFGGFRSGVGTLRAAGGDLGGGSETLVAFGIPGNWIGRKPENGGNSTQFMHEISPAQTATDKHGVIAFNSRQDPVSGDVFGALDTCSPQAQAIAIQGTVIGQKPESGPQGSGYDGTGVCFTQTAVDHHAVETQFAVRRLTPIECERLQGFPDNYTQIPWRNKPSEQCPNGHRYKALGNSMCVNVMRWIGKRVNREILTHANDNQPNHGINAA